MSGRNAGLSWTQAAESRLQSHLNLLAAAILLAGLVLRLHAAWGTFLNPDEALHFLTANQASLAAVYRESLNTAHPPLLMFVLYFWRGLGSSEFVLRLPSVTAGTGFCWFFYRWVEGLFGKIAGVAGLVLVALLPPMIEISSEIRQYALLLFFLSASVYFLEKALTQSSLRGMLLCWAFLDLALLTHYAAVFVVASAGAYCILRLAFQRPRGRLLVASLSGLASSVALLIFLYRSHIAKMAGSIQTQQAAQGWMRNSYYRAGQGNVLLFIFARTVGVMQFLFGQLAVGDVLFLLFVAGIALVFLNCTGRRNFGKCWQLGVLFLLPFALNCAAAIVGKYPYGGTRHCVYLGLFAIAAISYALARIVRNRVGGALGVALLIVALCAAFGHPHRPYMMRQDQSKSYMTHAVEAIQRHISSGGTIVVDSQTGFLLRYYLCPKAPFTDAPVHTLRTYQCGGYRVISSPTEIYLYNAENFLPRWNEVKRDFALPPGDAVWVLQAGWDVKLASELQTRFPEFHDLQPQSFGQNITLFKLVVR